MYSVPTTPGDRSIDNRNGSKSVETAGVHSRGHAHELSSKKRLASKNNSPLPKDNLPSTIDKMDVNKIFENNKSLVRVNHSPIKVDLSSPAKLEDTADHTIPEPKRLKLELGSAPNLSQPDHSNNALEPIEMLDSKSSPQRGRDSEAEELYEAVRESKEGRDSDAGTPTSEEKMNSILDLHRLTPIHNEDGEDERDDTAGNEIFQIVSRRNEELVTQINDLNRSINEVINSCDSTIGKYRKQFDALRQDYENRLDIKIKEIASVVQERENYQEKFNTAKRKVLETRDEIKMLNQNQSILKNKYEEATTELEEYKEKINDLEEENSRLRTKHLEMDAKLSELDAICRDFFNQSKDLSEKIQNSQEIKHELESGIEFYKQQIKQRDNEFEKLRIQLDGTVAAQQGTKDEKTRQLEDLMRQRDELKNRILNLEKNNEQWKEDYKQSVDTEVESIRKISRAQASSELELKGMLSSKDRESESWQKKYEMVNDEVEILRAEVKELNSDIDEQKELRLHLETSIAQLEEQLNEWRQKYEENRVNYDKMMIELDSVHYKYRNSEGEHLMELEHLHDNLSALQSTLKNDSEVISVLTRKNDTLEAQLKDLQIPSDLHAIQKELNSLREKFHDKEIESNRSLKLLAEDLYIQYSSKHEQKVKLLKKGYETKYQAKLDELSLQNEGLQQEVEQLKSQLTTERKQKQELIGLLENQTHEST